MTVERDPASATPEAFMIGLSRDRDDFVIALAGELDLSGVAVVADAIASALESDARTIVVDLRALDFLDSTGVHAILRAERLTSAHDRGFVVVRGPEQVHRIFEIAGIADSLAFRDG